MTWVLIKKKDKDENETVELAAAGHVRIEIDAAGGLISRSFDAAGIVGVEFTDEPKAESKKAEPKAEPKKGKGK